jgi:GNAT superfamily N-acetyltransferase
VYVSPKGAGRRIGSALILRAVEGARAEGRRCIWLRAMADLPQVLARYEAAGFVTFGNTAITTPGVRADRAGMVMMRCALT